MADRAFGPKKAEDEIFDLANDPRWQARLDEARARREQALQDKAPRANKPRLKPWEEQDQVMAQPLVEPFREKDSEGMDLADRLERLKARKAERRHGDNGGPGAERPEAVPEPEPEDVQAFLVEQDEPEPRVQPSSPEPEIKKLESPNSVFDEPTFQTAARTKEEPAEQEDYSASLVLPPSEVRRFSRDPQPPRRPWLVDDEPDDEVADGVPEDVAPDTTSKRRLKAPFGLAAIVLAAGITPFLVNGPAFEHGPAVSLTPTFAVQAELGLPAPFVNWPAMSDSEARFYSFRAKADRIFVASRSDAPGVLRVGPGFGAGPQVQDISAEIEVAAMPAPETPAAGRWPLPDALAGVQSDEFGLNRLRLYLSPERPVLRPDVALITGAN